MEYLISSTTGQKQMYSYEIKCLQNFMLYSEYKKTNNASAITKIYKQSRKVFSSKKCISIDFMMLTMTDFSFLTNMFVPYTVFLVDFCVLSNNFSYTT